MGDSPIPVGRVPFKGEEFQFGGQWYIYVQNVGDVPAKSGDRMVRIGGHGQMYEGEAMVADDDEWSYGTSYGPLDPGHFGWVKKGSTPPITKESA